MSREPEQLDLLDWLAAQPPGPAPILPAPMPRPDPAGPAPLLLTRVDPACNMRRFYSLALVTSLFGEAGVARQWGRIGAQGQRRTDWHASLEAAAAELERMAGRKRRRGYR
ncbi:WGR domain-containing protein [Rubellimicrobium aerolatum]|uniref:WGR domain-containing protein n=1 Tax=Rubellimicrobium aerolatum TaxID=490979 RepID=A0ABW0SH50_9RHOB|nr:putative DNA-binding WGR domain protein [Rubellimicrobium aerolatum]